MLNIINFVEINEYFSDGKIGNIDVLNDTIWKINNSENWLDQLALLLKALVCENCFKDSNKETAVLMLITAFELHKIPNNQDKILNMILTLAKQHIVDLRRIKRMIIEAM